MSARDAIAEPWGTRTPYGPGEVWPTRVDSHLSAGISPGDVDRWVQTASTLHSNGDAMDIAVAEGKIVGVRGRADDRVNRGRLDPKDLFSWQANASTDRLTRPLVRDGDRLVESDWDTAMEMICKRASDVLGEAGPSGIGFYTTGQLFLEEYHTLAAIARGGIGTNHLDGNTRLCTATAAAALKESFGCDGQPGSYSDIDHADVIALFGHNMAETQCVLWSRILDRLAGSSPPKLVCVDPRRTPVAAEATVHLAPLPGTNQVLMNAILHQLIANEWIDRDYIDAYTVGFDELASVVADYPPRRSAKICRVPMKQINQAARLIGTAERLVSTVLQGFYQSHQATAAVGVNNVHLVRGMLGKPGAGVLQMNGQPTAQNTRECGANGDLTGFRNWANPDHVEALAQAWNVEAKRIPSYGPPTHLMQIMRYAEQGTIQLLWVSCTNPAVSLPELQRVRSILSQRRLFLVVQDIFRTETAELADVVLPAATWGEKTGTFTNADRTVHLSEQAVDPPGDARPDLNIFLDFARRMDFRDVDGQPFPQWHEAESAFEAWKQVSAGRPCDYTGLSYDKLRDGSGIQWPCDAEHPDGTERLYTDGTFFAQPDYCEHYGRDLVTGAQVEPDEYRLHNPHGKAMIKSAEYLPPHERPSEEYPYALNTGRTLFHFHTRTKTGRAPQLHEAAPDVWLEISPSDARTEGINEGDLVDVISPRGSIRARARIADIADGVLFVPFHYGYWDADEEEPNRAANELTITDWDPASKQPLFKTAAARISLVARGRGSGRPRTNEHRVESDRKRHRADHGRQYRDRRGNRARAQMKINLMLRVLHRTEHRMESSLLGMADRHVVEHEIHHVAKDLARWSQQHVHELAELGQQRGINPTDNAHANTGMLGPLEQKASELTGDRPEPALLLLADLRRLHLKAVGVAADWQLLTQGALATRDDELLALASRCRPQTLRQAKWAKSMLKIISPQTLAA